MAKVRIVFTVTADGDPELKINGIKGKACRPIHEAVSASLGAELGIVEVSAHDTPEAGQSGVQLQAQQRTEV